MISTTHTRNGFHHDLLPMALTASCLASSALRNAMLAISAYHSCGTLAALPYKMNAVSYLSRALASNVGGTEIQMAASMMLCVYNVSCHTQQIASVYSKTHSGDRCLTKLRGTGMSTSTEPRRCCRVSILNGGGVGLALSLP